MSLLARQALVDSGRLFFQNDTQKSDLLNPGLTQTELIAFLLELTNLGFNLEITAVRTDHSDDLALGEHCHANGYCVDLWPLKRAIAADYMGPNDPGMISFLESCAASNWLYQIGLAGSAYTEENAAAAGHTAFADDGADHIHLGAM